MPQSRVVAISGVPGTGKSEVASLLGRQFSCTVWNLGDIAAKHGLIGADKSGRDAEVVDTKALRAVLRKEIPKAGAGGLVVEGHYADVVPAKFIMLAIVLRCRPEVLENRLRRRGYSDAKVRENVQAEILGDCTSYMLDLKLGERLAEVDTSEMTPQAAADLIASILRDPARARAHPAGQINWLQYLDERGELDKYMRNEK